MMSKLSTTNPDNLLELLRKATGFPNAVFREAQLESIQRLLNNERLITVQRTGWGKSIVYFIATRILRDQGRGITLLISPLLSLMRNQLIAAHRVGLKAATINSTNRDAWEEVIEDILKGRVDILLISPERLANEDFRNNVISQISGSIGLFVVDEVHCISDWGHDFRPDYRRIVQIINLLPSNTPVLGTTATANNRVVNDIRNTLGNITIERGRLTRESIALQNLKLNSKTERYAWLADHLDELPGTGIIYTLTKRDADKLARYLKEKGHNVEAYHAGLGGDFMFGTDESGVREELEQRLLDNDLKALVATVALGMGFDKPDLGFVVHFQRPGSVVHYYQQVGRAGRAVDKAIGLLMTGEEDDDIIDYFIDQAMPPAAFVEEILDHISESENGCSRKELQELMNERAGIIDATLKFLQTETPSPITKDGSRWKRTAVEYAYDAARVEDLKEIRHREQDQMRDYMETSSCLMHFLEDALDDPYPSTCGRCANCLGKPLIGSEIDESHVNDASVFLRHSHLDIDIRKQWPKPRCFSEYPPELCAKITIPQNLRPSDIMALSSWQDAGWGEQVQQGKYVDGRFSDQLVHGMIEMLKQRNIENPPAWVTCVPSRRHPELVPDFARRLAMAMGIPFSDCILKTRDNEEQKHMENSYHQCRNLDGVFDVDEHKLLEGPVLLIDDAVDSRWTLTLLSALLLHSGCEAVLAAVLTQTTRNG